MVAVGNEINIQESVLEFLEKHNIFPFKITYTGLDSGYLGITLYTSSDIDDLLELLDYKTRCDKSGYIVSKETRTVILEGYALLEFIVMNDVRSI